ncbi:hypothetical protein NKH18_00570 [Streptomyces sp. M10(2022)]
MIEALCAPARCPSGFDAQGDRWREEALKAALPALLARTSAKRLRGRLLVHGDEKLLSALAAEGTVTADDVPAILRHRRLWAGLVSALARRPEQVEAAVALLPRLADHEVERVVGTGIPTGTPARKEPRRPAGAAALVRRRPRGVPHPAGGVPAPPGTRRGLGGHVRVREGLVAGTGRPQRLGDARPVSRAVGGAGRASHPRGGRPAPDPGPGRDPGPEDARTHAAGYLPGEEDPGEQRPAAEPVPALSEELLLACLPALCLPELADLPNPQVTARRTLHHLACRVDNNPRLAHLAAEQLHAAADAAVVRGQLLSLSEKRANDYEFDGRARRLAEDLALLSTNPDHLAGVCAQLAALDPPAVVSPHRAGP